MKNFENIDGQDIGWKFDYENWKMSNLTANTKIDEFQLAVLICGTATFT